jgi:hypothetical protein
LVAVGSERLTVETVHLPLVKIVLHLHLHLASRHPGEPLWHLLATREGRS